MALDGRPPPDALEGRESAFAKQFGRAKLLAIPALAEREFPELGTFLVAQRPHIVVEPWNLDAPPSVLHLTEHLSQDQGGVGDRPAERPRVKVAVGDTQVYLQIGQPAKAVANRRHPAFEHRGVRDHDHIGGEIGGVVPHEPIEVLATDLLLAFENELEVDRELSRLLQGRFHGFHVHEDLPFVIRGPARVDLPFTHRCLEGRRHPFGERIDWLHIVVAVKEDRWDIVSSVEPVGIHDRVARRLDQTDVLEPDPFELGGGPLGATTDVLGMFRQRAHARNSQKLGQLVDVAVAAGVDEIDDLVHVLSSRGCSIGRSSRSPHSFHDPR